jgi:aminomethyltransferase
MLPTRVDDLPEPPARAMSDVRRTPLHDRHVALGARMIDFGGWDMPVYYSGINEEHRAVRARAGLFDVSHMGQFDVRGPGAHAYLQRVLSNDLDRIAVGKAQYTLLPNVDGGIVDDLIAYRLADDHVLLVVNAGNRAVDLAHLIAQLPADGVALVDRSDDYGMVALQGPASDAVLAASLDAGGPLPGEIGPFAVATATIAGVACTVVRTGYTGERGVELLMPAASTGRVWDALLAHGEHGIVPAGLGARDTLRLEVCYPLHGNDITAETDAITAGLGWVCALERDFTGADRLREIKTAGPGERLVAFRMAERAIPRAGMTVHAPDGTPIGRVTSGTLSPSLDEGIGMAYVRTDHAAPGTGVVVDVRGRLRDAQIAKKPLYAKES